MKNRGRQSVAVHWATGKSQNITDIKIEGDNLSLSTELLGKAKTSLMWKYRERICCCPLSYWGKPKHHWCENRENLLLSIELLGKAITSLMWKQRETICHVKLSLEVGLLSTWAIGESKNITDSDMNISGSWLCTQQHVCHTIFFYLNRHS